MKNQNPARKIDYHEHDPLPRDKFPETSNVASAQECTGLMHRAPVSQEELENERELFPMAIPRQDRPSREQEEQFLSGKSKK